MKMLLRRPINRYFSAAGGDSRARLLNAALAQVDAYGWTERSLAEGAQSLGCVAASLPRRADSDRLHPFLTRAILPILHDRRLSGAAHGLCPDGPIELVQHFIADCNVRTQQHLDALLAAESGVETSPTSMDVLRSGIHFRLEQIMPRAGKWSEAMSLSADPRFVPTSLRQLAELSDLLCSAASSASSASSTSSVAGSSAAGSCSGGGEGLSAAREWEGSVVKSAARRALVGGIYTAAEVFLVQDTSADFRETWDFVERRLDGLGDVSTTLDGANDIAAALGSAGASLGTVLSSLSFDDATRWTQGVGGAGGGSSSEK